MALYRKRPVVVEARKLTTENLEAIETFCGGSIKGVRLPRSEQIIHIQTLEGEMTARIGDYVIRGVQGEFYPCKPDIFEATYEEVQQ